MTAVTHIDLLLSPFQAGPLRLRNRICMPAMHLNYSPDGKVGERLLAFYAERARGGAALITVGGCAVDPIGGAPQMIGLHDDRFLPGLSQLATTLHQGGALALAQLYHAGRYADSRLTGQPAVAPSAIRSKLTGQTPRALGLDEIGALQESFVAAARRAISAGFDGVELIGSAGYLISQFLSPATNHREDGYGGPLENRARFLLELVAQVRQAIGSERALLVRLAGADFVEGSHGRQESAQVARLLATAGVDAINVTGGWHETQVPQLPMIVPRGAYLYLARTIREAVPRSVPVLASNRCPDPWLAEAALRDGQADLINFGRPLIADPELPRKLLEGRGDQIVHCLACNQGCADAVFEGRAVSCLVNPAAGREPTHTPRPAARARRVLVVGGGPAGMAAALVAARRGHQVKLWERGGELGGQLRLAGASPDRRELLTLVADQGRLLAKEKNVVVELGLEATPERIAREAPEVLILATGARPRPLSLPGAELASVVQAWDVLADRARPGRRVVVIGGGAVGVEVALELAQRGTLDAETLRFLVLQGAEPATGLEELCRQGHHQVSLVELEKQVGRGIGRTTRWTSLQALKRHGVEVLTGATVQRIESGGVWIEQDGAERKLPADSVVLAVGAEPERWSAELLPAGIEVHVIGDAQAPRRALEAIQEGHELALQI